MDLPPYPVSMSAMTGVPKGSRLHIMSAWRRMSLSCARPRSGWPSREAVVPAPVYNIGQYTFCKLHYMGMEYHV